MHVVVQQQQQSLVKSVSSFCRSLLPPAGVNSKQQQMSCNMNHVCNRVTVDTLTQLVSPVHLTHLVNVRICLCSHV